MADVASSTSTAGRKFVRWANDHGMHYIVANLFLNNSDVL